MIPMTEIWKIYDKEIEDTPMPDDYVELFANIQCRDCLKLSLSTFHILGIKCGECGSYNTVREKGGLVRLLQGNVVEERFPSGERSEEEAAVRRDGFGGIGEAAGGREDEERRDIESLTPPETPTRALAAVTSGSTELMEADRGILGVNPLTPEPSPVRDLADESRFTPSRSVARRISFTEEPTPDPSVNMDF